MGKCPGGWLAGTGVPYWEKGAAAGAQARRSVAAVGGPRLVGTLKRGENGL